MNLDKGQKIMLNFNSLQFGVGFSDGYFVAAV